MDIDSASILKISSTNSAIDSFAFTRISDGITGEFNNELLIKMLVIAVSIKDEVIRTISN